MNKKILIHSLVFSPDSVSTAYLYNDIAVRLKNEGYDVKVLTTTPHYNLIQEELIKQPLVSKLGGVYYKSIFNGIEVIHIPQRKYKSAALRIIGFLYWHLIAFFITIFQRQVALILSPSPPLSIGFINIIAAWLKRCKVVYNVQEIYPDFLIQQRGLKSGALVKVLTWLERFVYNYSDAVTTIDPIFYDTIVSRFKDRSKLFLIPNFVDTDLYKPLNPATIELDKRLFAPKPGVLKLMYAGNIGLAQDWEPLLFLAKELENSPVEFFVIGEGAMKKFLQEKVLKMELKNVSILPYQPRELMPQLIAYADLHFIFMTNEMEKHGFPSKVYTIMACAKPMLVSSGIGTPIVNFLQDTNCAFISSKSNHNEKCKELLNFVKIAIDSPAILSMMGENGYNVATQKYSKLAVTSQYLSLVNNLLKDE